MRWSHWLRAVSVALVVGLGTVGAKTAHGGEINFIEDFALAPDRMVPLKQLVPNQNGENTKGRVGVPNLRTQLSLLELRGDSFLADRFESLSIKNELITISGLKAGDYDLWLKSLNRHVRIRRPRRD